MVGHPFAAPDFTLAMPGTATPPILQTDGQTLQLREVQASQELQAGTWHRQDGQDGDTLACFDLPRGASALLRTAP